MVSKSAKIRAENDGEDKISKSTIIRLKVALGTKRLCRDNRVTANQGLAYYSWRCATNSQSRGICRGLVSSSAGSSDNSQGDGIPVEA
jgi:hypothetical protein